MKNPIKKISRRKFTLLAVAGSAAVVLGSGLLSSSVAQTGRSMRIGIIGSGNIGGAIGTLWAAAGHQILFSSRNPTELLPLAAEAGPLASAGMPREAVEFGEVILLALPYSSMPQIGRDFGPLLQGRVVIDCSNPSLNTDGDMATVARQKGSGVATAEYIPGARIVRAFGTINFQVALDNAHREGDKIAMPIAGADPEAIAVAANLVIDAGFEPVVIGGLERSKEFDLGTAASGANATARELRVILGL